MQKRSFYQDRLGTNIGKALKNETVFLSQGGWEAAISDVSLAGKVSLGKPGETNFQNPLMDEEEEEEEETDEDSNDTE